MTTRWDPILYQKTNLPENQTETIRALIASPFDDINISGIVDNISSNKLKVKILYNYIDKKDFSSTSQSVVSDYEEEDNLSLEGNEKVDNAQVKIEVVSYIKCVVKHSNKLVLEINRREMEKRVNNCRLNIVDLSEPPNEFE